MAAYTSHAALGVILQSRYHDLTQSNQQKSHNLQIKTHNRLCQNYRTSFDMAFVEINVQRVAIILFITLMIKASFKNHGRYSQIYDDHNDRLISNIFCPMNIFCSVCHRRGVIKLSIYQVPAPLSLLKKNTFGYI